MIGSIVKIENKNVHLITPNNKEEIVVLQTDIKRGGSQFLSSMTWNDSDSDFAKHDLVALKDNRTIGIVLTMTSDSLTILDIENYVSTH